MTKRALSFCLAVLIMLMALPMSIFVPSVIAAESDTLKLESLNFPNMADDVIISDFTGLDDSAIGNGGGSYIVNPYGSGDTTISSTIADGKFTMTWDTLGTSSNYATSLHYFNKAMPSADSRYLALHVDATNSATNLYTRIQIYRASGKYATAGLNKTFYFKEDGSDTLVAKTTSGSNSIWNATVMFAAGKSGTYYLPFDMFYNSAIDDLTTDTGYTTVGGIEYNIYKLHSFSPNNGTCIGLNWRSHPAAGSSVTIDDVRWVKESPLAKYTTAIVEEDFSSDGSSVGGWGDFSPAATAAVSEGGVKLALPAKESEEATVSGSYYALTMTNACSWSRVVKAYAYDLDLSEFSQGVYIRNRFYHPGDSKNGYSPFDGPVYFYSEDGKLTKSLPGKTGSQYGANVYPPAGFKGKVIIPVETMKNVNNQDEFSESLYSTNNMTFELEIRSLSGDNAGKNIYVDNLTYYVEPVAPEKGYDFSLEENQNLELGIKNTEDIKTVEVYVKPSERAAGTILAKKFDYNTAAASNRQFYLGLNAAGNVVYNLADGAGNFVNHVFTGAVVPVGEWSHIALVKNEDSVTLYINSAAVETLSGAPEAKTLSRLTVGHSIDRRISAVTDAFCGEIAELKLWSDVRTQTELFYNAAYAPANTEGLIAGYALADDLADTYSGGADIQAYEYLITDGSEYDEGAANGEYSIVFVPDIQTINHLYPDQMNKPFDWIINNKEKYNIQAVMGLGDITEFNDDDATADYYGEWERAVAQHDRLTEAGIPWTIVPGNHDLANQRVDIRDYTKLNTAFPYEKISQFAHFGGSYSEDTIANAYYYLTVGDVKYLLLCLDQEPRQWAMDWAAQVIANHPDYRVIVTTHSYMNESGVRLYSGIGNYTGWGTGEQIWEQVLAPFENVDMLICGHIDAPNIITRTDKGVNGNDILQVLVDTQYVDETFETLASVCVATFSADGENVRFRLYSTAREAFVDADSQFETALGAEPGDPIVDTPNNFASYKTLRDFKYFSLTSTRDSGNVSSQIMLGTAVASGINDTKLTNAKLERGVLRISPNTESASNRMDINFVALPTVEEGYNAIAIWIDASTFGRTVYPRFVISGANGYSETCDGTVLYALDDATGSLKKIVSGGWAAALDKNFKGYVIIPFDNTFSNGVKTAADFVSAEAGNDNAFTIRFMENKNLSTIGFDNLCYLKNFDGDLTFSGANVSLGDNIEMNYAVDSTVAEKFDSVRVEFEQNGNVANVTDSSVNEAGQLVFNFAGTYDKDGNFVHITPKNLADSVKATYYGTKDGVESVAVVKTYSAADYCYDILAGEYSAEAKRVAADLLNFAAENQKYMNYKVDSLVNAELEQSYATPDSEYTAPVSCTDTKYETIENPTVSWKGAGLNLKSAVSIRFKFAAESIEKTTIKVVVGDETFTIKNMYFEDIGNGQYYAYFNGLSAAQMREPVYVTVYEGGKAISNTLRYSVESYVKSKESSASLGALVKSLLKYGDATAKYAQTLKEAE